MSGGVRQWYALPHSMWKQQ